MWIGHHQNVINEIFTTTDHQKSSTGLRFTGKFAIPILLTAPWEHIGATKRLRCYAAGRTASSGMGGTPNLLARPTGLDTLICKWSKPKPISDMHHFAYMPLLEGARYDGYPSTKGRLNEGTRPMPVKAVQDANFQPPVSEAGTRPEIHLLREKHSLLVASANIFP
ncbi:hypothetical protein BDV93DRAFT_512947 [Ceratobasidium sp. AG-I]|nr:hypothetical protein BDV93DRAFT_512947 [Ceratobasidium sp. AG-I]